MYILFIILLLYNMLLTMLMITLINRINYFKGQLSAFEKLKLFYRDAVFFFSTTIAYSMMKNLFFFLL